MTDSPKTRPTGRAVQPWTWWELMVIGLSALLIGFPLFSEALRWVNPVRVPAQTSSSVPTSNDLRIGLAGNWGSAYYGDVVRLTVVTTNDHPDAALSDVSIELTLPPSLELVGAEADRGSTPVTSGTAVTYGGFNLDAGDTSRLTVDVRVADSAQSGSVLVAQAQGSFSGADGDSFSNIVTVLVLGTSPTSSPTREATATAEPTATTEPSATAEPTATTEPSATAEPTTEPSATTEPTTTTEPSGTTEPTTEPSATEPSATAVAVGPAGSSGSSTTAAPAVTAVSTTVAGSSRPTSAVSGGQAAATAAPATATDTGTAPTAAPASGAPTGAAAGGVSGSTSNLDVPTALLSSTSAPTTAAVAAPANNVPAAAANTPPAAAAGTPSNRLPETSAGAPLLGFLLLGSTFITRTVRLHRARERI